MSSLVLCTGENCQEEEHTSIVSPSSGEEGADFKARGPASQGERLSPTYVLIWSAKFIRFAEIEVRKFITLAGDLTHVPDFYSWNLCWILRAKILHQPDTTAWESWSRLNNWSVEKSFFWLDCPRTTSIMRWNTLQRRGRWCLLWRFERGTAAEVTDLRQFGLDHLNTISGCQDYRSLHVYQIFL